MERGMETHGMDMARTTDDRSHGVSDSRGTLGSGGVSSLFLSLTMTMMMMMMTGANDGVILPSSTPTDTLVRSSRAYTRVLLAACYTGRLAAGIPRWWVVGGGG